MVINYGSWWLMINYLIGGFFPTPLKNDGVSSSVGMIFHSQLFLESHEIHSMVPVTTNQVL